MRPEEILSRVRFDFPEEGRIVVGLSGGADSVLLTDLLCRRFGTSRLLAVHVHHGIRGEEADRDASFAEAFCAARGVPFRCFRRDVPSLSKESGEGLEACARRVRYDCFREALGGDAGVIVTAHNADDNAETVLMHLLRGSGPQGIAGIPPQRGNVFRPLLYVTREEVEFLCEVFGLPYITDSTNADPAYTLRNRIRGEIVPLLKEMNPRFVSAVSRFSEAENAEREFLRCSADTLLREAKDRWGWSLPVLRNAHSAVLREALRSLAAPYKALDFRETLEAERCVREGGGATFSGLVRFEAGQGTLTVSPSDSIPVSCPLLEGEISLPDGRTVLVLREKKNFFKKTQKVHSLFLDNAFDCDTISCVPVLRTRKAGDRFSPVGRGIRKSLRRLMSERHIPAAVRDSVILVEAEGEIVWVEGIGPAEGFAVTEKTEWMYSMEILPAKADPSE